MKFKMKIMLLLLIVNSSYAQIKLPFKLENQWKVNGFENPESIVKDKEILYVSNVNGILTDKDGNGYISKVSLDGKIIQQKWIIGLNAPKGLGIYGDTLYVADIDVVMAINIKTKEKILHKVEGATFLNDITVDNQGNVYVSNTFGFSAIYRLSKGKVSLWMKDESLNLPNGLYVSGNDLYIANWGTNLNPKTYATEILGNLIKVNILTKEIIKLTKPVGNLDGISKTIHGFLITDWLVGKLLYINEDYEVVEVLDLPQGSADIYFDKSTKTIYIPLMLDNQVLSYQFKKIKK